VVAAATALSWACPWRLGSPANLLGYLALTVWASLMKSKVPGLPGSFSLGFVAILSGVAVMGLGETLLAGACSAIAQTLWRPKHRPKLVQLALNVAVLPASVWLAYTVAHAVAPQSAVLRVAAAVVPLYLFNTGVVAWVMSFLADGSLQTVWDKFLFAVFPCYLVGGVAAAVLAEALLLTEGWVPVLPVAGLLYLMFNSYRTWLARFA